MQIKKSLLAAAVMAIIGTTNLAMAAPAGGSSNDSNVVVNVPSNFPPPTATGNSGLRMLRHTDGQLSGSVDIHNAPINQVNTAVANGPDINGNYWANQPGGGTIAQVWKVSNKVADIYSLRQVDTIDDPGWPQFSGLVIGQVKDIKGTGNAYPLGSGVYFGEWSPQNLPLNTGPSTDLNMANADRTVWYVGDNAVASTPNLSSVGYNVVGIRQTGEGSNLPGSPVLYTGTLTANYSVALGAGNITGSIGNGTNSVNFAGTQIHNDGRFTNANAGNIIDGRFYNGAEALAGIYTGGAGSADDVAFGGSKISGTITP